MSKEREVSNLKNEAFIYEGERRTMRTDLWVIGRVYLGYMKLGMYIIYQSGDAK